MYTIVQICSEGNSDNIQTGSSVFSFNTVQDCIKECHKLNTAWLVNHYKGDFILIHVPFKIK